MLSFRYSGGIGKSKVDFHAEAYINNNSEVTPVKTANSPVMVRFASPGLLMGFSFGPGSTGSITAYSDGSGKVIVDSVGHGLESGHCISITGTTNYNGVWQVTKIDADHFSIPATWVSDDGASDWCEGSYLKVGPGGAGHYIMSFNFSCSEGGGAGSNVLCETYVNCIGCPKCISKRKFPNNDYGALVGQSVIDLAVGDRVYFTLSSSGTNDLTLEFGNFNLHLL